MAVHELATNAVKYGALSNAGGRVGVSWRATSAEAPRFEFRWAESGGPAVGEPSRRGFGSRMIERGLSQDIGAEIELSFAPSGLVCTIEAPIEEISGA